MPSESQIAANQANAQLSTGPRTEEGKARVSRNATKLGLFSATAFISPDQRQQYDAFVGSLLADLTPRGAIEASLANEIIQAAWRLRRCTEIESRDLADTDDATELERIQISIDRARATAQRSYLRSLNELRRVQSERVYRQLALPTDLKIEAIGQAECRKLDLPGVAEKQSETEMVAKVQQQLARGREIYAEALLAKQTQSVTETGHAACEPRTTEAVFIPRGAPCPCGSGEKYKRCCGRNAPPMLTNAA